MHTGSLFISLSAFIMERKQLSGIRYFYQANSSSPESIQNFSAKQNEVSANFLSIPSGNRRKLLYAYPEIADANIKRVL